jgi:iron complex outermembrane receptor protein
MKHDRIATYLQLLLLLSAVATTTPAARAETTGSQESPVRIALPDSLARVYRAGPESPLELDTLVVRARRIERVMGADHIELGAANIRALDGSSVADLGVLLPSTQLMVNSRGESLLMVRGASERHVDVELDGIPLIVPWDERVDLSTLPLLAIDEVEAQRGVGSALDDPNALAGVIRLRTPMLRADGSRSRVEIRGGEAERGAANVLHEQRDGRVSWLAAGEFEQRSATLIPKDLDADYHQTEGRRARTNSDRREGSLLLRIARDLNRGGELALLLQGTDVRKGVPPETHLEEARFWRYPTVRRGLAGLSLRLYPDDAERWAIRASFSTDWFHQEIRDFDDASYTSPPLQPGIDYETADDRTVYGRVLIERSIGPAHRVGVRAVGRHTRHRESLLLDGPSLDYSQLLGGIAAEWTWSPGERWQLRGGIGGEASTTPETGDKPDRDGDRAPTVHGAVQYLFDGGGELHAAASRRSRFPSLREMFSGALGRFVVNPDLRPEEQDLFEFGGALHRSRVRLSANLFLSQLDGAIERINLDDDPPQFQRVNLDEVRTLGAELGLVWQPLRGFSLDAQHTILRARRKTDGDYESPVEDRPDYLTTVAASLALRSGLRLRLEGVGIGPRYSLDARQTAGDGLTRLDSQLSVNARVAWRHFAGPLWYEGSEIFLRVDNVFDAQIDSQIGLPQPGRTLLIGWRLELRG